MAPTTILFRSTSQELPTASGIRSSAHGALTSSWCWRAVHEPAAGGSPFWPRLLHEHFEVQADLRPGGTAVEVGGTSISYGELERRANRLARHLRAAGAARGTVVSILLPRSVTAYVAMLAVLKAGAAYLVLDPEVDRERPARAAEWSGATMLVITAVVAGRLRSFDGTVVRLDGDGGAIERRPSRVERSAPRVRER